MIPTVILYAMMIWQQGCRPLNLTDAKSGQIIQYLADGCAHFVTTEPFDIPPVEHKEHLTDSCHSVDGKSYVECTPIWTVTGVECADKSRFLLYSQDGKSHCLALKGQP